MVLISLSVLDHDNLVAPAFQNRVFFHCEANQQFPLFGCLNCGASALRAGWFLLIRSLAPAGDAEESAHAVRSMQETRAILKSRIPGFVTMFPLLLCQIVFWIPLLTMPVYAEAGNIANTYI